MKRLIADNTKTIEQILRGSAKDGREILKALEEFKFKIEQCDNLSMNSDINDKIHQHYDMLDKLMSGLYSICFDLENIDLVPLYDNEQINLSDQSDPDSANDGYDLNEEFPAEQPESEEEPIEEKEESENEDEESSDDNSMPDLDEEDNNSEEESEEE
nr:MAG TPA: hypothetical protein [Caudoviricetes sp.]